MRRVVVPLNLKAVLKLVSSGTGKPVAVGPKLYLNPAPGGASFLYRYVSPATGKPRSLVLGPWDARPPAESLAWARAEVVKLDAAVAQGNDPQTTRKEERKAQKVQELADADRKKTFVGVALDYIEAQRPSWSPANFRQWRQTLRDFVYRPIGHDTPMADVNREDVLRVLKPLWAAKKIVTGQRVMRRMRIIIDAAKAKGLYHGENPATWEVLKHDLPNPSKLHRAQHFKAIAPEAVPHIMAQLARRTLTRSAAAQLLLLTAARPSVVTGARWGEFDFQAATWTVPAERMKSGRKWQCPLSAPALALLRSRRPDDVRPDALVFPGARRKVSKRDAEYLAMRDPVMLEHERRRRGDMSHEQLTKELRQAGSEGSAHGARSAFKIWTMRTARDRLLSELQLAHSPMEGTEAAYAADDDLLEQRRALLDSWGAHCLGTAADNVVPLRLASA